MSYTPAAVLHLYIANVRLQARCRRFAEWTGLGAGGCTALGACLPCGLGALTALATGESSPAVVFAFATLGYLLGALVLSHLTMVGSYPQEGEYQLREYHRQLAEARARRTQAELSRGEAHAARAMHEMRGRLDQPPPGSTVSGPSPVNALADFTLAVLLSAFFQSLTGRTDEHKHSHRHR